MPSSQVKRDRLAQVFAADSYRIREAAWSGDAPVWIRDLEAVQVLRQVLVQTHCRRIEARGREVIVKRDADEQGVPPDRRRLACPYDAGARGAAKGDQLFWCGPPGPLPRGPHQH